ncbi:MAG: PEP-CTERM sorting domain-containing protein [Lysobacteraceae bacterium]|nr:MAG: PEP-CTERM sorting domain-containing protein [Xanthomonadaceae bacterium]
MKKSLFLLPVLALPLLMSTTALAAVVTFEDQGAFRCEPTAQTSGGMKFTHDFYACFYSPANPADFPTTPSSTTMAVGLSDTRMSRVDGSLFDLQSVELAFGPFNHGGRTADTTLVTGTFANGGTVSTTLTVGFGFDTFTLNWANLSSVTFGALSGEEYMAFDNITYTDAAVGDVPEPASIALLGAGLLGLARSRYKAAKAKQA